MGTIFDDMFKEREMKANASDVKNLMETTGWSVEKSLAALKIPEEDHSKILLLLS